jgi:hypothetical protein
MQGGCLTEIEKDRSNDDSLDGEGGFGFLSLELFGAELWWSCKSRSARAFPSGLMYIRPPNMIAVLYAGG